ncbi:MAG: hypothetical protein H0U75_09710 [Legionella sp.]|nr:hypothetical protein [Legionella sp.]
MSESLTAIPPNELTAEGSHPDVLLGNPVNNVTTILASLGTFKSPKLDEQTYLETGASPSV